MDIKNIIPLIVLLLVTIAMTGFVSQAIMDATNLNPFLSLILGFIPTVLVMGVLLLVANKIQ